VEKRRRSGVLGIGGHCKAMTHGRRPADPWVAHFTLAGRPQLLLDEWIVTESIVLLKVEKAVRTFQNGATLMTFLGSSRDALPPRNMVDISFFQIKQNSQIYGSFNGRLRPSRVNANSRFT
jgi:hypothetical protein